MFRSKIFSSIVSALGFVRKSDVPPEPIIVPTKRKAARARFRRSYKLTSRQKGLTIEFAGAYVAHIPWSRYREEESDFKDPANPTIYELMRICPKLEDHYVKLNGDDLANREQDTDRIN